MTSTQWNLLKILSLLLKPFELATKLLSARRYPTIGLCLFVLHHIKLFLEAAQVDIEVVKELKKLLLNSMVNYVDKEEEQMRILRVSH